MLICKLHEDLDIKIVNVILSALVLTQMWPNVYFSKKEASCKCTSCYSSVCRHTLFYVNITECVLMMCYLPILLTCVYVYVCTARLSMFVYYIIIFLLLTVCV